MPICNHDVDYSLWKDLREKAFSNTSFSSLDALEETLCTALTHLFPLYESGFLMMQISIRSRSVSIAYKARTPFDRVEAPRHAIQKQRKGQRTRRRHEDLLQPLRALAVMASAL